MRGYLFKMMVLADNQTLSRRFIQEVCRINGTSPPSTIGVEFYVANMYLNIQPEDRVRITFQIWRMLDHPRLRILRSTLYLGAKGAIILLDLSNRQEFVNLEHHIQDLRSQMPDIAIILVGFNTDDYFQRQISSLECLEMATSQNITYVEFNIMKVPEIFQLLGHQMTRIPIPEELTNLVQLSHHSGLSALILQLQKGEMLNERQLEFFQKSAGFKERELLEHYLPADHSIFELFNTKYQILNQLGYNLLL